METQASALEVMVGADAAWKLTLRDRASKPITTYTSAAALSAACWQGDDQAALFSPSATWIDPASGTIALAVSAAQTATLTAGVYDLLIAITAGGLTAKRPIAGGLRVLPSPGSALPRLVYSTYDDMRRHAGRWLDAMQRSDADQTGFAEERADARNDLDDLIQRHYRGSGNTLGSALTGYSPWSGLRYGFASTWLQGILDGGGLIVTKQVREYCSLNAIAAVCRRQVAPEKDGGYLRAAGHFALRADNLAASLSCGIDCNADGLADLVIHLGTVDRLRA